MRTFWRYCVVHLDILHLVPPARHTIGLEGRYRIQNQKTGVGAWAGGNDGGLDGIVGCGKVKYWKILVTGSNGLIGSEAVEYFDRQGHKVVGVDNNMRRVFFGPAGDTLWNSNGLKSVTRQFTPPCARYSRSRRSDGAVPRESLRSDHSLRRAAVADGG